MKTGKVYLVGGGPGDPELITLRGVACLEQADVVLYDYLVNPLVLEHARQAERICLGQHGRTRVWSQDEINERLVELAREGKTVVRLKGGDPIIFARAAEEIAALSGAGIPFELVPGVTAALAAGSYAGIPVTHRELASAVALITAHEVSGKNAAPLDYRALAQFPGTLVFYMGVTTAETWTRQLIAAGKPADCPAAIVRRCSLPDQQTVCCTLAEVAARLHAAHQLRPPAIVVIGEVATLRPSFSWFDRRPLFGRAVLITRPREQAQRLADLLREQGAEPLFQPAVEIGDPPSWERVDQSLGRLEEFDWILFFSTNGVESFFRRLQESGRDVRALGRCRVAAIGPATAAALATHQLCADFQPRQYRDQALADELVPRLADSRCLLVRASRGSDVAAERLAAAGAEIEQVVAYSSTDVLEADAEIRQRLTRGEIDWVTVTSSATARSLVRLFGDALTKTRIATISPVTSAAIREAGFEPSVEAQEATMEGLTAAVVRGGSGLIRGGRADHVCSTGIFRQTVLLL